MPYTHDSLKFITLSRAPGLNIAILSTALDLLGGVQCLLAASSDAQTRAGIPATTRAFLQSASAIPTPSELGWLEAPHHHLVSFTDPRYPPLLRSLAQAPIALYVDGNIEVLSEPGLAIVGSRNPTAQGRDNAFEFAKYLASRGLTIISGLAEGIDTAAHRGALAAQGTTIAVLGCGLDSIYPPSNQFLSREIAQSGALISEFAWGTPPRAAHFPQRNRIIAALSLGTLVVEAARQSGSLITARLAGEVGREVFAIPGSIHNPLSRGCHQLIRQGAKLTETAADILGELNFSMFFGDDPKSTKHVAASPIPEAGMDKDHKILLDALGFDPTDLDQLVVRSGFKADAVSSMMLILELEGHVKAAPGGRYSRIARSF